MSADDASTPVTIFGRTYHLRGEGDASYLHELAREVDRRMREVAETTGTADTLNVAILAALNATDDCLQAKRRSGSALRGEAEKQLGRFVALIDDVLADPGCRPSRAEVGRVDENA